MLITQNWKGLPWINTRVLGLLVSNEETNLTFASKAKAYSSEATFTCSLLGLASGLSLKHLTRLEGLVRNKYSRLLGTFVLYDHKVLLHFAQVSMS